MADARGSERERSRSRQRAGSGPRARAGATNAAQRPDRLHDPALNFVKWFAKNKFALMASFLPELEAAPRERDRRALRDRFCAVTDHAQKVLFVRLVVTILLVLAGGSTLVTTLVRYVEEIPGAVEAVTRVTAVAASATLILIIARLALDRYLELISVSATYLAMELATAPRHARPDEDARSRGDASSGPEAA